VLYELELWLASLLKWNYRRSLVDNRESLEIEKKGGDNESVSM